MWASSLGAGAILLPDARAALALGIFASLLVVVGLQPIARRAERLTDLPSWAGNMVGAGIVAAVLVPSLGGGVALALAWLAVAVVIRATSAAHAEAAVVRS